MDKRKKTDWRWSRLCFLLLLLALLPGISRADIYGFTCFNGPGAAIESQFTMAVDPYGTDQVKFTFYNNGPTPSFIRDVYFDDGVLLGIASILDSPSTVDFDDVRVCPKNVPGWDTLDPVFRPGTAGGTGYFASAGAVDPGSGKSGVDVGESLGIVFDLVSGKTLADVEAGLDDKETLRVAIFVAGIPTPYGPSADYINDGKVPLPGAVLLGLLGLSAAGMKLRRFA